MSWDSRGSFKMEKVTDRNCLCHNGRENLQHFMFLCPNLLSIRQEIWKWLENELSSGNKRYIWKIFAASSLNSKLSLLLGDLAFDHGDEVGWLFDAASKKYITEAWKVKGEFVEGTL